MKTWAITIASIQAKVSAHYAVPLHMMTSPNRERRFARPRQVAMYLARELTPRSFPDIGRRFGGRDHTTVLYADRHIRALREQDQELADDIALLEISIEEDLRRAVDLSQAYCGPEVGDPQATGA